MKKITLLNFPFTYYEPIRKTGDMNKTFSIISIQKDERGKKELKEMRLKKAALESEIAELSIKAAGFNENQEVIAYREEGKRLKKEYSYNSSFKPHNELRDKIWKAYYEMEPQLLKDGRKLEHAKWDLKCLISELEKREDPMNANIPFIHTPLQQKHINLMNREIAKRAHEGWEMDSYKLLETEFFNDYKDLQKCYSGVLFTWISTREKQINKKFKKQIIPDYFILPCVCKKNQPI